MTSLAHLIAAVRSIRRSEALADAAVAVEGDAVDAAEGPDGLAGLQRELALLEGRCEREKDGEAWGHLAELDEMNRLATVGRLTMGMAHELGTPLGIVIARAQMIQMADTLDAGLRQDASEIVLQVKRMTQMCREVLDYARPKPAARAAVDVIDLARRMMALLVLDARKRNAKLVLQVDLPPVFVLGDGSKLMQVLANLILNAAQAMPRGGQVTVSVGVEHVAPPATEALPADDYVCVHVADDGTGISAAELPHVFETFFTTKTQGEGTGLGLTVSARIARAHGGWIGVTTEVGTGSRFTLYLPRIQPSL